MWTIFEVFIEFFTVLLLSFMFCFFWQGGLWDLSSLTRDDPAPPALEGEILITGPPESPWNVFLYIHLHFYQYQNHLS